MDFWTMDLHDYSKTSTGAQQRVSFAENWEVLSWMVKLAQRIAGPALSHLDSVYAEHPQRKARSICKDKTHLRYPLFAPLP